MQQPSDLIDTVSGPLALQVSFTRRSERGDLETVLLWFWESAPAFYKGLIIENSNKPKRAHAGPLNKFEVLKIIKREGYVNNRPGKP